VSTVSRVIRGRGDVSEETRSRVVRVIEDLQYRPSAVARALVSGYSKSIALLVSDIANPFYPQLAKSIEREASRHGYALQICNTGDDPKESAALVRRLLDQGVEGMIHASVGPDEQELLRLVADPRRIVFTNRRPRSPSVSFVVADNVRAATLLTQHLIDAGHRRIGFVSGPSWASNAEERLTGFLATVREYGAQGQVAAGDFSMESGASAVTGWREAGALPTAIIGVNDSVALGAISALRDLSPPVAVAGFDDIDLAGSQIIGLTSVAGHIGKMGERAVRLLLRQLVGRSRPPVRELLTPTLHVRRTTTIPGTAWLDRSDPSRSEAVVGKGGEMLFASKLSSAKILNLPGRDWSLLLGPDVGSVRNVTLGYSTFPPGSAPAGHTHPAEEEIVFVVKGRGRLISPDCTIELEPGVAVYIPVGVEHATAADPDETLELVTVFSPPVVPGSYERG
jgi:LacI family transcriptional regulator